MKNMSGDRFNYYLKVIMNSRIEDLPEISEQFENDITISSAEAQELERVIDKHLNLFNRFGAKVVNAATGAEETPPRSDIDNFGNTSVQLDSQEAYGLEWKVYAPNPGFANSPVKKWYYNRKVASILNELLTDVVPGRLKDYFDYPPWLLGTVHAPSTIFMPINEIINLAIGRGVIPDWDYLVARGLPKALVDVLRTENIGYNL
ncbi:MAG: hypothetical protein AMDU1_APLC00037G0008 [Thermoplasmatales archaeon A-plasma]|jgi:hypothetical protein|nr:MAG: hypothetical protein AMDU1_APLC00037G0008 [Thermoplasmatales archaeon A-plasma]